MADKGRLQVRAYRANSYLPIANANVTVTIKSEITTPGSKSVNLVTNAEGRTDSVEIETPPVDRSLDPNNKLIPYALVDIKVSAEGYDELIVRGVQILPGQTAIQVANLIPLSFERETPEDVVVEEGITIPPNVQYGEYPPKIPEDPEKPLPPPPSGLVVLPEPIIPEFIIVHAGAPDDTSAPKYKVPYTDYLKNVASSEIYATWPEAAIRANLYAINSFALNRIYTEWYRGKGYDFDITNSTAHDQAFEYGRNIYDNISNIVDDMFSTYIKKSGEKQPLLTQYCDGRYVSCPKWMTQWGSKDLGDRGYIPYEILTYYYGNDIELVRAPKVAGSPKSYPGYILQMGSSGEPVRTVQTFLNRIAQNYPLIGKVPVDGVYGEKTAEQVKRFQDVFNLPITGEVDYATWYKISAIYVGVTKIAELRSADLYRIFNEGKKECAYFIPPSPYKDASDIPKIGYLTV